MTSRSSESSTSSIHESYRITDSDEDDEEDNDDNDNNDDDNDSIENSTTTQVQEIEEVRSIATNTFDNEWIMKRNRDLLTKMLELDDPAISPRMVDFLLHEGVSDMLLGFVTQIGDRKRPYPHENDSLELKYSYRVISLFCLEQPTDHILAFMGRRIESISRAMFDVFRDDSAGSFYHAARVIETLLRLFPSELYNSLISDGLLEVRMKRLLRYIGYPPVGDLTVILIGLTPLHRSSQLYSSCSTARWNFFGELSRWILLSRLTEVVLNPSKYCNITEYITSEQHSIAAAQTLIEIIEKLSSDELGEILLSPLGYSSNIIESLLRKGTTSTSISISALESSESESSEEFFNTCRRLSLKLLCFFLQRSINETNTIYLGTTAAGNPIPTHVPNRLYPSKSIILDHYLDNLDLLQNAILNTQLQSQSQSQLHSSLNTSTIASTSIPSPPSSSLLPPSPSPSLSSINGSVTHPGHICIEPFSSYRAQLVELLVIVIEMSPSSAVNLSPQLWKLLISWIFKYPHNNIYHSMFYKLFFVVLRENDETTIKNIFKGAKIITYLLDYYDYDENTETQNSSSDDSKLQKSTTKIDKKSLKGFILNLTNAIRLQMMSLPPTSFLRSFLQSHQRWNQFLPTLRNTTLLQQPTGMGFSVPTHDSISSVSHLASLLASASLNKENKEGIDHGSAYAKSLGFDMEIDWPMESAPKKKGKKKKKNQKKKQQKLANNNNHTTEKNEEGNEEMEEFEVETGEDDYSSNNNNNENDNDDEET